MTHKFQRTPKNYNGSALTTHRMSDLLPLALENISSHYQENGELIINSWPQVIGPKLASMTQAISFKDGILLVKVKNSTLYSLLSQNDKPRILNNLRQKFPKANIQNVLFRIG